VAEPVSLVPQFEVLATDKPDLAGFVTFKTGPGTLATGEKFFLPLGLTDKADEVFLCRCLKVDQPVLGMTVRTATNCGYYDAPAKAASCTDYEVLILTKP
jgi:hypothetical protein